MAKRTERTKKTVEDDIDEQLGNPTQKKSKKYESVYKMMPEAAIPVSKAEGSVWEGRMKGSMRIRTKTKETWEEALKYYNNDQMSHRISSDGSHSGNVVGTNRLSPTHTETENIVFANVTTLVPAIYAKNPTATVSTRSEGNKPFAKLLEELLTELATKKLTPGVGLKPKAKRVVALTELTNNGWVKLTWTRKEDSSPEAVKEYQDVVAQLSKAKSGKEIEKLENKLRALEDKVAFSTPSGMGLKVLSPFNVIKDPTGAEDDLSDSDWLIELDYIPTGYLNCVYGEEDEDGNVKSIYKPSHIMKLQDESSKNEMSDLINNFSLLGEEEKDYQAMGFTTQEAYERAQYTEVAIVWDKIKKRVLMYATNDWKWPVWVWDDPLKLDRFFPYYKLSFYQNPLGGETKGEVTYYLDQQDAINEINDEQRRSRHWLKRNILFNKKKVKQEDVDAYLKGVDETARGVDLADGESWEDVIWSQPTPGFKFYDMFTQQKQEKLEAINRVSSMNDIMSGMQFKTNTTNQAIESYQKSSSIRTEDRIDSLEDFLSDVLWGMAQLALMNYSPEEVVDILDRQDVAMTWRQITDPKELRSFSVRVVGGSTTKPTSAAKKEEAVKVAQSLGQFANAAPMVVMKMLEVLEDAFDNLSMTDEEWAELKDSILQMQANSAGGTPAESQSQAGGGEAGQGAEGGGSLEEVMSQLPPEAQQAVQLAVERGVPPEQAVQGVLDRMQQ